MYYEINVSHNGRHYFATHERSGRQPEWKAIQLARDFKKRFPVADGFQVTLSLHTDSSRIVDINDPKKG